jgi:hypothetical protein
VGEDVPDIAYDDLVQVKATSDRECSLSDRKSGDTVRIAGRSGDLLKAVIGAGRRLAARSGDRDDPA